MSSNAGRAWCHGASDERDGRAAVPPVREVPDVPDGGVAPWLAEPSAAERLRRTGAPALASPSGCWLAEPSA
ncbi:hypothetical protein, partial [Streptomyces sp. UNOC14_S4]|uniref:hypothetical protein n=1 Tax=Streptomyces sp. UNOC14_S4 TaxID=2872340 RepID=UPI001E43C058